MSYDTTKWHCAALLCAVVLGWAGCNGEVPSAQIENTLQGNKTVPDGLLAIVGDVVIGPRDLREYEVEIQTVHKSKKEGSEGHRDHLLSLVDEKLIVREADARGLGDDPELIKSLKLVEHNAMVESYLHATVGTNIKITEEELRENFNSHPARYAVKGAHILVATKARADSLYALIQAGTRSFEDLAMEYSLDEKTAENGGEFASYYVFDRVSDQVYKQVFSMDVGQVSEPFRTAQGWELGKVVDKESVSYEKYRPVIQRATMMKKFNTIKQNHIDSLQYRLNLQVVPGKMKRFVEEWNRSPGSPNLTPEEFAAPLYTFDGGEINSEQVMYLLVNTRIGEAPLDSALVDERVRKHGVTDLLLAVVARAGGFAEEKSVLEQVVKERDRKLLAKLWKVELEGDIEVTEQAMRAHYEAHPERYKIPEEIVIQEILVADRPKAEQLMDEIRAGADMADLATRHSIRRYSDENGGLYAMRAFERIAYKELMDAAVKAPNGELMGPIEINQPMMAILREPRQLEKVYSIFKVLERLPERVQTYELSKEKANFYVRQAKQQERVVELNKELRRKYIDDWGINETALEKYTAEQAKP
jgi:parvulin-like peptidyl-prolyl isomerase